MSIIVGKTQKEEINKMKKFNFKPMEVLGKTKDAVVNASIISLGLVVVAMSACIVKVSVRKLFSKRAKQVTKVYVPIYVPRDEIKNNIDDRVESKKGHK